MKRINEEKLQEVIGWTPFPAQKEIVDNTAKSTVAVTGIRFGKSMAAAYKALRKIFLNDQHIYIIAPTYDLTLKVFSYVEDWLHKGGFTKKGAVSIKHRPRPRITTKWGTWLECKSGENPEQMLGERLDLAIIDEAARVPKEVFERYLYGRTKEFLLTTTPKGKNWLFREFMRAKKEGNTFHFTSLDSPLFNEKRWEDAKARLPEDIFNQEYGAKFLDAAASAFRSDDIRRAINDLSEEPQPDRRYVVGVDLAKYQDYFALCVIDKYTNGVVYFYRSRNDDYGFQKEKIKMTSRKYNRARVVLDSSGMGEPVYDDLIQDEINVEPFRFSNQSKKKLIDKLRLYLEQGGITIPDNEALIDELESFEYEITPSGNVRYQAPEGLHDDCVIALALAVWSLYSTEKENPKRLIKKHAKVHTFEYY